MIYYAALGLSMSRHSVGSPIRANDLYIAAHARRLGLTLVTHTTAEFERSGLALGQWTLIRRRK